MNIKKAYDVLMKYWGYADFRYPQKDIIESVLTRKHTLAIMPTGGGKSLCYQVPGLILPGTTLVISPLIALMMDQVKGLRDKGVRCEYLHSGMTYQDLKKRLELAIQGHYSFLFISPERLQSSFTLQYLKNITINLLVIDEAHCISEWGYDFRPSYLKISDAHEALGKPTVLALTATATPEVELDIISQLNITPYTIIRAPLKRDNLIYSVIHSSDKLRDARELLERHDGSAIIYVNSRRGTERIAYQLKTAGFSADFYHAGLDGDIRSQKQIKWIDNKVRIMVATNAFGMGIDKPDVRLVIHMLCPSSIEAYYQEAGRAGRDGLAANAFLLFDEKDKLLLLDQFRESYPPLDFIRKVYKSLAIENQVASGQTVDTWYPFHLETFANKFKISARECFYALQLLVDAGHILMSESLNQKSQLKYTLNREDLYQMQLRNKKLDVFTKQLLRLYEGLFSEYVPISEFVLARALKVRVEEIKEYLRYLAKENVVDYREYIQGARFQFVEYRYKSDSLTINQKKLKFRRERHKSRMSAILNYAELKHCREDYMIDYLGDVSRGNCGRCDFCMSHPREDDHHKLKMILNTISAWYKKYSSKENPLELKKIFSLHKDYHEDSIQDILRILELENKIKIVDMHYVFLSELISDDA